MRPILWKVQTSITLNRVKEIQQFFTPCQQVSTIFHAIQTPYFLPTHQTAANPNFNKDGFLCRQILK